MVSEALKILKFLEREDKLKQSRGKRLKRQERESQANLKSSVARMEGRSGKTAN